MKPKSKYKKRQFIKGMTVNEYHRKYRIGELDKGKQLTHEQVKFIQSMVWVKTSGEVYDKII